jgi:ABC-2 type transport system ATP-binding protein
MLEVEHYTKRYGDFVAVDDLSFAAQPGEILGLVGPNGAGKTTTLRALAGVLKPTAGTIRIAGHDLVRDPIAAKRSLAFVPDTPNPFEMLTVLEHLRFTALAYRVPDAEPRFEPLLREFGLWEKRDALGSTLSRGMRQKLAFACAFVRDARVLLLDEPLTGLDPRAIRDVREAIQRRAGEGVAVLVSSHLLDLVQRVCHRILVLDRGRRVALGTLEDIRAHAARGTEGDLEALFFAITEPEPPAQAAD